MTIQEVPVAAVQRDPTQPDTDEEVGTTSRPSSSNASDDNDTTTTTTATKTMTENNNNDEDSTKEEKEDSSKASSPPSLTRLLKVARPEWPALFFAVLLMIASEAIQLMNPLVIARAYDALVQVDLDQDERMTEINKAMLLVLGLHFGGAVAAFFRSAILGVIGERLVARLRNQLYGSILSQEIAFFDEHKSGELVSRLGSDTTLLQNATSQSIPEFFLGIIKLMVGVALMFWISTKLAAMTLGSVFIIFIVAVPFGTLIGRLSKAYQDELGAAQTRSTESLGAMRTVQSFAAEDRERQRYRNKVGDPDEFPFWYPTKRATDKEEDSRTTYSVGFFKAICNSGFFTFMFGFGFAAMYASLWYGFKLVTEGEISLGDLTAFQSYIFQIGFGLAGTSGHLSKVLEALGASGRIFYLLDRVPAIPTPPQKSEGKSPTSTTETTLSPSPPLPSPLKPKSMQGAITINSITFSYPSRPNVPVLKDFSLSVPPNTTAALVGSSGAGKSTVVALLQRFYDVNSGAIQIDGNDIRSLVLSWLRQNIGYVQQEPTLFGLTVRENICYGVTNREVTQEELESVCRKANAHDFISQWPQGYDTLVGERGVKLSGGQKQRVAIARALLGTFQNCLEVLLSTKVCLIVIIFVFLHRNIRFLHLCSLQSIVAFCY